jgi:hypothetical protein
MLPQEKLGVAGRAIAEGQPRLPSMLLEPPQLAHRRFSSGRVCLKLEE